MLITRINNISRTFTSKSDRVEEIFAQARSRTVTDQDKGRPTQFIGGSHGVHVESMPLSHNTFEHAYDNIE